MRRRSRKGAWIEILQVTTRGRKDISVAPVRERGLKSSAGTVTMLISSRSRKGAWIEIHLHFRGQHAIVRRSRKGAWIEIAVGSVLVAGSESLP